MSDTETAQIYLATPAQIELATFREALAAVYDAVPVACLRISLASRDEDVLARAGDVLRELSHARDIPVVIDDHFRLVERIGLDGVHLTDGARRLRDVRKELGREAIVGAYCGASRHVGMTAGELGADYVSFGPVSAPLLLDDVPLAEAELFAWWSQMIEVPVVAEGGLTDASLDSIAPVVDFVCLRDEVWLAEDPAAAAKAAYARLEAAG